MWGGPCLFMDGAVGVCGWAYRGLHRVRRGELCFLGYGGTGGCTEGAHEGGCASLDMGGAGGGCGGHTVGGVWDAEGPQPHMLEGGGGGSHGEGWLCCLRNGGAHRGLRWGGMGGSG